MSLKERLNIGTIIKCILIVGALYVLLILLTIQFNKTHESLLLEYTFPINLFNIYFPKIGTIITGSISFTNEIINIACFILFDLVIAIVLSVFFKKILLHIIAFLSVKAILFLIYFAVYHNTVLNLIRSLI